MLCSGRIGCRARGEFEGPASMNLEESLALHARGPKEWNRWAAATIDRRDALVAAGQWHGLTIRARTYIRLTKLPGSGGKRLPRNSAITSSLSQSTSAALCSRAMVFSSWRSSPRAPASPWRSSWKFNYAQFGDAAEFENA